MFVNQITGDFIPGTLDGGGGADDERLLEGLRLAAQAGSAGLQRDALLGQTGNVDGSLLVQSRLVVEQWHRPRC